jgi:hypothetical protein
MQEALDFGAMALFGEKYGEHVRVLKMGGYSTELCGGTHVGRTGDIGLFKIVSEGGVSSGVRRIEAVTGQGALDYVTDEERRLNDAARLLGGNTSDVNEKLRALLDRQKKLERELEQMKAKAASGATSDLAGGAVDVNGTRVLAVRLEGFDAKALRDAVDRLKQQLGDAVIVLAGPCPADRCHGLRQTPFAAPHAQPKVGGDARHDRFDCLEVGHDECAARERCAVEVERRGGPIQRAAAADDSAGRNGARVARAPDHPVRGTALAPDARRPHAC